MNILLIDDSRFLRLANERALTRVGHTVITAPDGEKGLELARGNKLDLIVLDMMLPKISGLDVLRALRKDPTTASIPVMVLSSLSQCNEEKVVAEGATAYFEKSLLTLDKGPSDFVNTVQQLLTKAARDKAAVQ